MEFWFDKVLPEPSFICFCLFIFAVGITPFLIWNTMVAANSSSSSTHNRLKVAWISDFPLEWMSNLPVPLQALSRKHPATWLRVLLNEFQRRDDVIVHVIALRNHLRTSIRFDQNGSFYHVLPASGRMRVLTLFWLDTFLIRRELQRIQPDLVHAWGTEHAAALVASRLDWPYLITLQGLLQWYATTTSVTGFFPKLMTWLEPVALRRAMVATTESSFAVNFLRQRYPNLHLQQVEHAANTVFHQMDRDPKLSPFRLISLGTLDYRKGTDLLFKALAKLMRETTFELVVVSGANRNYLESLRPLLPSKIWDRVIFKSDLSSEQVAEELRQAALLVLPTRSDTSPNAVKEAAVAGVPVVASCVGGIPDYITHGKNGLLFPAGNLDSLVSTLREAMTHSQFSRGQVDVNTWHNVREYLSPERMASSFLNAYAQVFKAWNLPPPDWSVFS